jgi:hypothetical protein
MSYQFLYSWWKWVHPVNLPWKNELQFFCSHSICVMGVSSKTYFYFVTSPETRCKVFMVTTIMDARNIFCSRMNSITLEPILPYPFHDNYPMVFQQYNLLFCFQVPCPNVECQWEFQDQPSSANYVHVHIRLVLPKYYLVYHVPKISS